MSVTRVPVFPDNLLSEPLLIAHVVQYYVQFRSMVNRNQKKDKGTKRPGSTLAENCAAPLFWTFSLPFCSNGSLDFLRTLLPLQPLKCWLFLLIHPRTWGWYGSPPYSSLPPLDYFFLLFLQKFWFLCIMCYWIIAPVTHSSLFTNNFSTFSTVFLFITSPVSTLGDFNINVTYTTTPRPSLFQE